MVFRDVTDDGTVRVTGKAVPVGGSQPTIASVVAYSGSINLQATNVEAALDELDAEKAPLSHTHTIGNVTGLQTALDGKAATNHNHDGQYYTEAEVNSLLSGKSDTGHVHTIGNITGLQAALDSKAASGHVHTIGNVTGLQAALDAKSDTSHTHDTRYYTESEMDTKLAAKSDTSHIHDDRYFTETEVNNLLAGKAPNSHNHDDRYFTETEILANYFTFTEVNNKLAMKSDVGHVHTIANVTGLQAALDAKSNNGHIHDDRYYTELEVDQKIASAVGTVEAHDNPSFDIVSMSPDGPGDDAVAPRLYPSGWSNYWTSGDPGERPILEADSTVTRYGSGYSLKVTLPGTSSSQTIQSSIFAVTGGALISAEAWIKGGTASCPFGFLTLYTNQDVNPGFFVPGNAGVDSGLVMPGTEWQKISVTFTVPAGHNRATLMVRANPNYPALGAGPGTIWWDETKTRVQVFPPSGVVTGEIKMWPMAAAPAGYLLCQGGTFSSDDYPALASVLGDTFGTHSGTTYYLPDFRGRSPIGAGTAAPAVGGNVYTIGQKIGHEKLQSHNHTQNAHTHVQNAHNHTASDAGHGHAFTTYWSSYSSHTHYNVSGNPSEAPNPYQGASTGYVNNGYASITIGNATPTNQNTTATNNATGAGNAENMHPVLGINYIIKAA